MIVVCLLLEVSWVCLQFVIVVFPDHTHLLFLVLKGVWFGWYSYPLCKGQWVHYCLSVETCYQFYLSLIQGIILDYLKSSRVVPLLKKIGV